MANSLLDFLAPNGNGLFGQLPQGGGSFYDEPAEAEQARNLAAARLMHLMRGMGGAPPGPMAATAPAVGVLALQGAFREHRELLDAVGVDATEVRAPADLTALDALILPGGESTTIGKLLTTSGLLPTLTDQIADGLPVLGTCAGLILLAAFSWPAAAQAPRPGR